MRILLVGEYNKAHYNIKLGLESLGHEVLLIGLRDGFKHVAVDISLKHQFKSGLSQRIRHFFLKLFKFDLLDITLSQQIKKHRHRLSDYDVVQFINEAPFACSRKQQQRFFDWFISWNKTAFLLSCGTDYISVSYAFDKKFRYDILTPYFEGKGDKKDFAPVLSYLKPEHKVLHTHLFKRIKGVISNDLDYAIPLEDHPKHLGMIPHAINTDALVYNQPNITDKIVIFHGVNRYNYYKKGNDIFDDALEHIKAKYPNKVTIIRAENLPYDTYIKSFDNAHIVLDQIYAYDQGFNALEAMAKGKVVFTGAEDEWLQYYNLQADTVAINALPDVNSIVEKLSWLIEHPNTILEISKSGRAFVEQHHNYINCAKSYLEFWDV